MAFPSVFYLFPRVTQLCAIKLTKGEISSTFPVSPPTCDAIRFSQFKVKRDRAVALNTKTSQQSSELSFRRVTCTCTTPRGSHEFWGRWIFYDILVTRYTRIMRFPKRRLWLVLSSRTGSPRWTVRAIIAYTSTTCRSFLPRLESSRTFPELAKPASWRLKSRVKNICAPATNFSHYGCDTCRYGFPLVVTRLVWATCIDDCDIAGYVTSLLRDRDRTSKKSRESATCMG